MDKNSRLTQSIFESFHPNITFLNVLEDYKEKHSLESSEIVILEWGCGRGELVLWLRLRGYQAFGVELNPKHLKQSRELYEKFQISHDFLQTINDSNANPFHEKSINIICSFQVLEHVRNLQSLALNHSILLKPEIGLALHVFPGSFRPVEPHICYPFVHWLPKIYLRFLYLYFYGSLIRGKPLAEARRQASQDTNYLKDSTFYRSINEILKLFQSNQLHAFVSLLSHKKIQQSTTLRSILKLPLVGPWFMRFLSSITTVYLFVQSNSAPYPQQN
jgi:SAM-dependent methyltransferase